MKPENEAKLKEYQSIVQDYLGRLYASYHSEPQKKLFEAMEYSLLAGGKRLRPVMALEFCRMCGGELAAIMPLAAAVEMIHTYSLIHDDLPCMDNDDYRRGRLTNHKVYGETIAVLAGDALLTDAFCFAASAPIPGDRLSLAVGTLANCAGSLGMVGGQVLDILSEERECSEKEVLDIQTRKTGALINAACALGVIAGGGTQEQLQAACGFAAHIGLAFQIRDDMLDVIGSEEILGKAVGVDAGKNTFVALYGLEQCEQLVADHTRLAIQSLSVFPDHDFMEELAKSLTDRVS